MVDLLLNLAHGFAVAFSPINLLMCLIGALVGTLVGVLPGIGTVATVAMLLPITVRSSAGRRADHARRHLLRRPIWRFDHLDPGQHPGRERPRWSRRSTATRWPNRAAPVRRWRSPRSVRSSPAASPPCWSRSLGAPLTRLALAVRPGRVFLADGARPDLRRGAGERLGAEGDRDDRARIAAARWSAPTSRPAPPAWPSTSPSWPTASASRPSRWAYSVLREIIRNLDAGAEVNRDHRAAEDHGPDADQKDLIDSAARSCAAPLSDRSSASCRAAAP